MVQVAPQPVGVLTVVPAPLVAMPTKSVLPPATLLAVLTCAGPALLPSATAHWMTVMPFPRLSFEQTTADAGRASPSSASARSSRLLEAAIDHHVSDRRRGVVRVSGGACDAPPD